MRPDIPLVFRIGYGGLSVADPVQGGFGDYWAGGGEAGAVAHEGEGRGMGS
jgi:hypothetical protein